MVLFDSLLGADDFGQVVDNLAREFREEHRLPEIHQLGLVVPAVEDAAAKLEGQGLGPFFIADGSPVLWRERGQEREFKGKMGIAYRQGVELELLGPGEGSDFYRQSLDPEGRIVVQHLGFTVQDVDEWAGRLAATGSPVWVRGELKMGPVGVDFAYLDTVDSTGFIIELITWRIFGRVFSLPAGAFHVLGHLEKWSGKRSFSV